MKFTIAKFLLLYLVLIGTVQAETIAITLGTSGLGKAVAEELASKKHRLILLARDQGRVHKIAEAMKEKYQVQIDTVALNFDSLKSVKAAANSLKSQLGKAKLDGLVLIGPRPVFTTKGKAIPAASEFEKNFRLTFSAPLEFVRLTSDVLNMESSVVVISGITSKTFLPEYLNSNVFRIIWSGMIKNLVHQLKDTKTRVNAVSPGVILTETNQLNIEKRAKDANISTDEQLAKETAKIPVGRLGQPEDVAQIAEFLLSKRSGFVNGGNIGLDGGGFDTSY